MFVADIMTKPAVDIAPGDSIVLAITKMRDHGVGFLPVIEAGQLRGVLTDRDILTRCLFEQVFQVTAQVADIMTPGVRHCLHSHRVEEAAALMGDHQVRRLPVCDGAGMIVGVLSLGDIAEEYCEHLAGEAFGEIVEMRGARP